MSENKNQQRCKNCHDPFNSFGVKDPQADFITEWCHLSQLESKKWVIMVSGQEWDEWSDDCFYVNTYKVPTRFCPMCGRKLAEGK